MSYTVYTDPALESKALACAKGGYQTSLLYGGEAWSGATLRGKAKEWSGSYHRSRNALLARLRRAGIPCRFETIERRKVLIIGPS